MKRLARYGAVLLLGCIMGVLVTRLIWTEPPTLAGRIRTECESLVDLAHRDNEGRHIAKWEAIEAVLVKKGVKLPPAPQVPRGSQLTPESLDAFNKAAKERNEYIEKLPEYGAAWSDTTDSVCCAAIRSVSRLSSPK